MTRTIPNKTFIEHCLQRILDRALGSPGKMGCEMVSRQRIAVFDKHYRQTYPVDVAFTAVSEVITRGGTPPQVAIWDRLEGKKK